MSYADVAGFRSCQTVCQQGTFPCSPKYSCKFTVVYFDFLHTTQTEADFCKCKVFTYLRFQSFELYKVYAKYNKATWENKKSNVTLRRNFSLLNTWLQYFASHCHSWKMVGAKLINCRRKENAKIVVWVCWEKDWCCCWLSQVFWEILEI